MELLVTIAAGSIVILGVYRLLISTMWSYNLQNQMTDMYQNATYTIKRMSESLQQAGADLPALYYPVIITANPASSDIQIRVNKYGGKVVFPKDTLCDKVLVAPDSVGKAFLGADSLLVDTGGWRVSVPITSVKTGYALDTVVLASSTLFGIFNVAFCATSKRYFLSGTNFCVDSAANVQAENIDSLGITFRDSNHVATTDWSNMVSVSLYVRARTASKDPKYKCPGFGDGYHRLALNMDFRLRNKF